MISCSAAFNHVRRNSKITPRRRRRVWAASRQLRWGKKASVRAAAAPAMRSPSAFGCATASISQWSESSTGRRQKPVARFARTAKPKFYSVAKSAALSLLAIDVRFAWPQTVAPTLGIQEQGQPPPSPQADPAPAASPAPSENPGLIHEMGRLFGKILPPLKSPTETIDDLNARAKDAGDALSRLAKPSSMVSGRTICPIAVNGTPDCKTAADTLCQSKGYKDGKSLNADSAEKCSPKVLIPGRQRKPDDCRTDTFVTSALCQ